ncbi:hypothetical protein BGP53_003954 [Salmonella enterica subsp. enterica serovar Anatum]|nr:hypothetical protein [Salmonella enterica subsp. enterica serovar Anatum]
MRDKTRRAMRLFLGGRCYTAENLEKDYLAEVANYSNDRWKGVRLENGKYPTLRLFFVRFDIDIA